MEKTQLEVGDLICERDGINNTKAILKVTRVTDKFAFVGNLKNDYETKFQRKLRGNDVTECNRGSYSQTWYALATDQDHKDIQLMYAKRKLEARFNAIKGKLMLSEIEALMAILNSVGA